METKYRLLLSDDPLLDKLDEYFEQKGLEVNAVIGWPSIVALRGDEIVGVIATQFNRKMVICGPIHSNSPKVAIKLLCLYEDYLTGVGVTCYWFSILDFRANKMLRLLRRKCVTIAYRGRSDRDWETK